MTPADTLTTIFRHNLWANLRLIEACAELSADQLDATLVGGFGSIRDTLKHIALAERSYFSRISTGKRYRGDEEPESLAQIKQLLLASGTGFVEWAKKVRPDDSLSIDWDGTPRDVPKTVILTQVINHATEHRAQIMVIMTQLGVEPPSLDSWTYFDEKDKE